MGLFAAGQIVTLPFPFSDLSREKLRPVLILADAGRRDWIVCQITSNPYTVTDSIALTPGDFVEGLLHHVSYVRPGKLFTANETLMTQSIGRINQVHFNRVRDAVVAILQGPRH